MSILDKMAVELAVMEEFSKFELKSVTKLSQFIFELAASSGSASQCVQLVTDAVRSFAESSVMTGVSFAVRLDPTIKSPEEALAAAESKRKDIENFSEMYAMLLANMLLASAVNNQAVSQMSQESACRKTERFSELCQEFLDNYRKEFVPK